MTTTWLHRMSGVALGLALWLPALASAIDGGGRSSGGGSSGRW